MTRRIPPVIRNEIARAYRRGDKVADTGRDFGVDPSYPTKLAKREGVPLRRGKAAKHEEATNDRPKPTGGK